MAKSNRASGMTAIWEMWKDFPQRRGKDLLGAKKSPISPTAADGSPKWTSASGAPASVSITLSRLVNPSINVATLKVNADERSLFLLI